MKVLTQKGSGMKSGERRNNSLSHVTPTCARGTRECSQRKQPARAEVPDPCIERDNTFCPQKQDYFVSGCSKRPALKRRGCWNVINRMAICVCVRARVLCKS